MPSITPQQIKFPSIAPREQPYKTITYSGWGKDRTIVIQDDPNDPNAGTRSDNSRSDDPFVVKQSNSDSKTKEPKTKEEKDAFEREKKVIEAYEANRKKQLDGFLKINGAILYKTIEVSKAFHEDIMKKLQAAQN